MMTIDLARSGQIKPMLAAASDDLPRGRNWIFEPKYDGFRCVTRSAAAAAAGNTTSAARIASGKKTNTTAIFLSSRNGKNLARYFPELVAALTRAIPPATVLDGEIVFAGPDGMDFDTLLLRIHPSETRVAQLSAQYAASYVAFDLLMYKGKQVVSRPFLERRAHLEKLKKASNDFFQITPTTTRRAVAQKWLDAAHDVGIEGVVAKRGDLPYLQNKRVMLKIRKRSTMDVVVVGVSRSGALLLGLYQLKQLRYIGQTTYRSITKTDVADILMPHIGRSRKFDQAWIPDGQRSMVRGSETNWTPLKPRIVCEISYDHFERGRLRHQARFCRFRFDKDPEECRFRYSSKKNI